MYKKRIVEKGHNPKGEKVETTSVVQGAMVQMWEYADEDHVFVFRDEVSADVQRRETHRPELTTRGTTPPLFSIDGSSNEQRQYKKVHRKKRDSAGEMKEIGSTMDESSVLVPVTSVLSLEINGTSVTFTCFDDYC